MARKARHRNRPRSARSPLSLHKGIGATSPSLGDRRTRCYLRAKSDRAPRKRPGAPESPHDRPPNRPHPQFLHRRPHRPRQVDARRPADPGDRRADRARDGEQVLDSMDIERERGITIKAQTVRLEYQAKDGKTYILNLMDTPGHVDFAYEVSRSLAACEGSLLVVDASQGVEAQTLANVYQAIDANHEIVPVLNKIDLPAAEPERVREQIEDVIGLDASDAVPISAKTGLGIDDVLEAIVTPPAAAQGRRGRAAEGAAGRQLVRRLSRRRRAGAGHRRRAEEGPRRSRMMGTDAVYQIDRIGVFRPKMTDVDSLGPGEVGFITAQIKQVADTRVGDTITEDAAPDRGGAARLQAGAAGGVLRPVPGRRGGLRGPARRHGPAAPQRRQLLLRDGDLRRARLRLPLRLPRPAAPGDHPGAARARVQPRPDRDRARRSSTGSR